MGRLLIRNADWLVTMDGVYASRGGADTAIVDGRVLMDAGVVTTIDEERTLEEGQRRGEAIAARSGLAAIAAPRWPVV